MGGVQTSGDGLIRVGRVGSRAGTISSPVDQGWVAREAGSEPGAQGGAARRGGVCRAHAPSQPRGVAFAAGAPEALGRLGGWMLAPTGESERQPSGQSLGNGCKARREEKVKSESRPALPALRPRAQSPALQPPPGPAPLDRGTPARRPAEAAPRAGPRSAPRPPAGPAGPGPSGGREPSFALFVGQAQLCYWR